MTFRPWRAGLWLGLNLLMAAVFLAASSSLWTEPELRDEPGASGGAPIIFGLLGIQLVGPMCLLNLVWLARAAWTSLPRKDWTPLSVFAGLVLGWAGPVRFSASML